MSQKPRDTQTSKRENPDSRSRIITPENRRKTGVGRGGTVPPPEHRFKPGQSGNPGGRPKSKLLTQAYRELLEQVDPKERKTLAEILARKAVQQALKGNLAALKEITDRTEGKSVQPLSHSGLGSEPIAFNVFRGRERDI
jgi:hypothetical protein